MLIVFLYNIIPSLSVRIIKRMVCFSRFEFSFEMYNTLRGMVELFSSNIFQSSFLDQQFIPFYTVSQKSVPQIEFTVTLEFLNIIYKILYAYTSTNYKPSVTFSWRSMEYSQITVTLKYRWAKSRRWTFFEFFKIVKC